MEMEPETELGRREKKEEQPEPGEFGKADGDRLCCLSGANQSAHEYQTVSLS